MKLTATQLRRIIKEAVENVMRGSSPVTIEVNYREFPGQPKMGDVTNTILKQQRSAIGLTKAAVVDEMGPARWGDDPIVSLTFDSMCNARAWWFTSGYADMGDIEDFIV